MAQKTQKKVKTKKSSKAAKAVGDSTPAAAKPEKRLEGGVCKGCRGTGKEFVPPDDILDGISQDEIAQGTGVSASLISRMLSENPDQQRTNPTLATLRKLQRFFTLKAKRHFTLDSIGDMIDG